MNALGRELKEEGKKSMDLMINILYVFYSFSHFTQFHQIISQFKIGTIVMKTVVYEERRYEELISLRKQAMNSSQKDLSQFKKIDKMLEKQERLLYGTLFTHICSFFLNSSYRQLTRHVNNNIL